MFSAAKANRQYFRKAYGTGKHGWAAEDPSPYAARFLARLKRTIRGGRLLDIGCGEGRHAILAAGLDFKVTAIDYEPSALKRAQRLAKEKFILSVFSPKFPLFRGSRKNWHIAHGAYRRCFTRGDILGLFGREFEPLEIIEENGGRHDFWHVLFRRRK